MIDAEQMAREILGVYTEHYPILKGRVIIRTGVVVGETRFTRGRAIKTEQPTIKISVYMPLKTYRIDVDVSSVPHYITNREITRAFQKIIDVIHNDEEVVYLGGNK